MDNTIETEALRETLAFAWRNRDRATEHQREQILISIKAHGQAEEALVADQLLKVVREQRELQLNLDGILNPVNPPQTPDTTTDGKS